MVNLSSAATVASASALTSGRAGDHSLSGTGNANPTQVKPRASPGGRDADLDGYVHVKIPKAKGHGVVNPQACVLPPLRAAPIHPGYDPAYLHPNSGPHDEVSSSKQPNLGSCSKDVTAGPAAKPPTTSTEDKKGKGKASLKELTDYPSDNTADVVANPTPGQPLTQVKRCSNLKKPKDTNDIPGFDNNKHKTSTSCDKHVSFNLPTAIQQGYENNFTPRNPYSDIEQSINNNKMSDVYYSYDSNSSSDASHSGWDATEDGMICLMRMKGKSIRMMKALLQRGKHEIRDRFLRIREQGLSITEVGKAYEKALQKYTHPREDDKPEEISDEEQIKAHIRCYESEKMTDDAEVKKKRKGKGKAKAKAKGKGKKRITYVRSDSTSSSSSVSSRSAASSSAQIGSTPVGVPTANYNLGFHSSGFAQPWLNQPTWNQPWYGQPWFNQSGANQAGFNQSAFSHHGLDLPGCNQSGLNQPGFPPVGSPSAGFPPAGFPPVGSPQVGNLPAGYPPVGSPPAGFPPVWSPPAGFPPVDYNQGSHNQGNNNQGSYNPADYPKVDFVDVLAEEYPNKQVIKPDKFWSKRDCKALGALEARYRQDKWLHIQAEFANIVGRSIEGEILQAKFEESGRKARKTTYDSSTSSDSSSEDSSSSD
ncbi:hypothetical protein GGR54DRAFT_38520 [Hypoxylon sp. NC1633]|nr:hypothetical protein GGR54DRAFT_38520 [Hypoxylon sp. NC1633]